MAWGHVTPISVAGLRLASAAKSEVLQSIVIGQRVVEGAKPERLDPGPLSSLPSSVTPPTSLSDPTPLGAAQVAEVEVALVIPTQAPRCPCPGPQKDDDRYHALGLQQLGQVQAVVGEAMNG